MSLKVADNFGIIDIGSNTIRGVLYEGGKPPFTLHDKAFSSHILAYTKDGILSDAGIDDLVSSLLGLKEFFKEFDAKEIFAFATSAMRDVKNFSEVKNSVIEKTGISIDLISGEEEAEFDYLAIKSLNPENEGICVDLGGGSAQVICYDKNGVKSAKSMPIGAKRVRNMFVNDICPNEEEKDKIEKYLKEELSWITEKSDELWFMGGTAKAVEKGAKKLFGKSELTVDVLKEVYDVITKNKGLLIFLFPERYKTMPVGVLIMIEISKAVGAKKIIVTEVGVRDGYVEMLLNSEI